MNVEGKKENKASSIDLDALLHAFLFLERRAKIKNAAMAAQDQGPGRRNFGHLFFDHASTSKSTYIDPDFAGVEGLEPYNHEIDLMEVECICGSLITQGYLNGYVSQKSGKVASQEVSKTDFPNLGKLSRARIPMMFWDGKRMVALQVLGRSFI
jgi:hypothetical protein